MRRATVTPSLFDAGRRTSAQSDRDCARNPVAHELLLLPLSKMSLRHSFTDREQSRRASSGKSSTAAKRRTSKCTFFCVQGEETMKLFTKMYVRATEARRTERGQTMTEYV